MKINSQNRRILDRQIEYYRARASEYDEWHLRQGRYDQGEEHRKSWLGELQKVHTALGLAQPTGRKLEIACGTGLWTPHLAQSPGELTAIDSSSESIRINREKTGDPAVNYITEDFFKWQPESCFDFIFFGFWLSHVPKNLFDDFWGRINSILNPGGKVFFVDSLFTEKSTAIDHKIDHSGIAKRTLKDGSKFEIVKVFYEPDLLDQYIRELGLSGSVSTTGEYFLYGEFQKIR